ncbi:C1orf61 isoform 2, partial [Pan troglodytes]
QPQGPPEQSLLLTEAWSWASKKKQPHLFSGVIVGGHLWLLGPKRRMYFIWLGWIPSDKPSQLTER